MWLIAAWLVAWRSFLRGSDGLSLQAQIDRNLTVAIGNLVVIFVLEVLIIVVNIYGAW